MGDHDHDQAVTIQRHQVRERAKKQEQLARPAAAGADVPPEPAPPPRRSAVPAVPHDDQAERLAEALAEIAALRTEIEKLRQAQAPLHQKVDRLTREAAALRAQLELHSVMVDEDAVARRVRDGALDLIANQMDAILPVVAELAVDDRGTLPLVRVTIEVMRATGKDLPAEGRLETLKAASAARATGSNVVIVTCQLKAAGHRGPADARLLSFYNAATGSTP